MNDRLCRICQHAGNAQTHLASEKMFGFGGSFVYFTCARCECLQIEAPDIDVSRYYPPRYYSFGPASAPTVRAADRLTRWRDAAAVFGGGPFGRLLLALKPHPPLQSLALLPLVRDMRVADVGCGAGNLLHALRRLGFTDLTGIDPHIEADIEVDPHLRIRKAQLEQVDAEFDLVMFHHSLEHIVDPLAALEAARARLAPGGVCLVRIPLVSSQAWRTYGTDWVQLDAPRHLYLHSVASMSLLARRSGFEVEQVVHDSTDFQFWGSEAVRRGHALFDPETGAANPEATRIARRNRGAYRRMAARLNRLGDGDQAVFVLRCRAAAR